MGDKVDNIPGIPGVGEKTAIQLIKDYGSIENLYENTDKLKGKLKEKVENNKEMALQSKRLATICLDCPVELDDAKLIIQPINKEALLELFRELEFRAIAQKVLGEDIGGKEKLPEPKPQKAAAAQDLFSDPDLFSSQNEAVEAQPAPSNFKTINDVDHNYELVDTPE